DFAPSLSWVLGALVEAGLVTVENGGGEALFRRDLPLPGAELVRLRDQGLELEPGLEPVLDLLDAAGRAYPAAAFEARAGEEALLGPAGVALWGRYFSNANPLYAFNNRIAALAAANRLTGAPLRLLEVGAGGGSGTEALLEVLRERDELGALESFQVTEPSPFFRRRSQRALGAAWPGVPLSFADLDIDRPWAEQGVEPGSLDLVYGVNVLHVAKNLGASLAEAFASLRPGGWLVAGECLRPYPGQTIAIEMVFELLPGFRQVELDPEIRPEAGFLTPEQWRAAFSRAGFAPIQLVPDVESLREVFAQFFVGAVCGRKPLP
ncbi:MAG TPA: class I SAM-dependent methyltransferase, partial [Thermoanaerobaculia bacterium]|nr:class I SAM-dependent methyltransferase [Thermoanaerobaculia bacterium]